MKTVFYGKVMQQRYIIDWSWDNRNDYGDILNRTEKYVKLDSWFHSYEEIKDFDNKDVYDITESKYDATNNTIEHYLNYVVRTIEPIENDRQNQIDYARQTCKDALKLRDELKKSINRSKWYQFWK